MEQGTLNRTLDLQRIRKELDDKAEQKSALENSILDECLEILSAAGLTIRRLEAHRNDKTAS